jgi:hypothetical protein
MKKMMFLMLALFFWGSASMNAQVRIGGTGNPNNAAVLDLNADNEGTPAANAGGLSLPRISLDTTNVKLNNATPVNGTVVYNTNASMKGGQGVGLYMWSGSKWNNIIMAELVSSISIAPTGTIRLIVGTSTTLEANTAPDNASNPALKWTTDNASVATVNSKGKITAVAAGTCTITVTSIDGSNKSTSRNVIVIGAPVHFVDTIGTRAYDVVTLPDGLGTWMMSGSKEGTPDYKYGEFSYYTWHNASKACPPPYAVPDSVSYIKAMYWLNSVQVPVNDLFNSGNTYGGFVEPNDDMIQFGSYEIYWSSSTAGHNPLHGVYALHSRYVRNWQPATRGKNARLQVRCWKP